MPLYAGKYAICALLQNMRNMLRSHDRYKPVSLYSSTFCQEWCCHLVNTEKLTTTFFCICQLAAPLPYLTMVNNPSILSWIQIVTGSRSKMNHL